LARLVCVPTEELEAVPDKRGDAHQQLVTSLESGLLRRRVRALPMLERLVICWRYGLLGERLVVREIAERLGVSVGTAYNLEQRGLARLRLEYVGEVAAA
jgi:DNA-directed RNA polymerase specialized sigma subunit